MAQLGRAQIQVTGLILYSMLHSSNLILHINNKMQLFKLQKFSVPLTMCNYVICRTQISYACISMHTITFPLPLLASHTMPFYPDFGIKTYFKEVCLYLIC